ncbi:MAG: hypothetical protein HY062_08200 [Bacteroidetes bacterium]|nr:hypothetical protein [Bacteroidota bacterium]
MRIKITLLLLFVYLTCPLFGQQPKELQINGIPVSDTKCAAIKVVKTIPEISAGFICDIRDAQMIDDCLELMVVYGDCNGNLELMTDSIVTADSKLHFKLRWIEPSFCKSILLTKVSFDLKPYKKLVQDKMSVIKIMGTNFELYYND